MKRLMKRTTKYLYYVIIALYLFLAAYLILFPRVERYGVVESVSAAGDIRFKYYDMEKGQILENRKDYPWFFARVTEDKADDYVKYISEHEDYVFKIVGNREKDDCGYFGSGVCLENVKVSDITAYSLRIN